MRFGAVEISVGVLQPHYDAGLDALRNGAEYQHLAEQTAEITRTPAQRHRQDSVALMPLTQFAISTTLDTMRDPQIWPALPREVSHRATAARECARFMIENAVRSGAAISYYSRNPHLRPLLEDPVSSLNVLLSGHPETLQPILSLGELAILDASIVAGGALRFLKRSHPEEVAQASALVGNSTTLQDVTGVPDDALIPMRKFLGMPYARASHFLLGANVVDFTQATRTHLRGLYSEGKGCPARYVPSDQSPRTVLQQSWADIVDFLLPNDATVFGDRGAAGRRGKR